MKIGLLSVVARLYVWLLFKTCKFKLSFDEDAKELILSNKPCIITFWHSRILVFPKFMTQYGSFSAVISSHGDAEVLARIVEGYGHRTSRGSSRKNAFSALKGMINLLNNGTIVVITPDGPKGPRYKVKGSTTKLAAKMNVPVIPVAYSASYAKILRSWDRFLIPLPIISRIFVEFGEPIYFSDDNVKDNDNHLENIMLRQVKKLDKKADLEIDYLHI